jgi:hypothetical protein
VKNGGPRFRITLTIELTGAQMDELALGWRNDVFPSEPILKQEIRRYLGLKVVAARIAPAGEEASRGVVEKAAR